MANVRNRDVGSNDRKKNEELCLCRSVSLWAVASCCTVHINLSHVKHVCLRRKCFKPCFFAFGSEGRGLFGSGLLVWFYLKEIWTNKPWLIPVYSYLFDMWNPDMTWHVYVLLGDLLTCFGFGMFLLACLCCRVWFLFIHICLTDVLLTWVAGKRWKVSSKKQCYVFHCFEMSWWGSLEVK